MTMNACSNSTSMHRGAVIGAVRAARRLGFTILELLVVITIIVLGTSLVVPAIGRVVESNNYAAAINLVTGALGSARAEAIRTGRGTAVVFLFDIETQVMTLQVCEQAGRQSGSLGDTSSLTCSQAAYSRAYRPAVGTVPIELPRGTAVYGLAFDIAMVEPPNDECGRIDDTTWHWYAGEIVDEGSMDSSDPETYPWIFPRNDVRLFANDSLEAIWGTDLPENGQAVRHANTFMIQFDESGAVVSATSSGGVSMGDAYIEFVDAPLLRDDPNRGALDDPYLFDPQFAWEEGAVEALTPNPEVLLRSAQQLAVVDLNRLAREVGVREPWFVRLGSGDDYAPWSDAVAGLNGADATAREERVRRVSNWIDLNAEILSFNRFTGQTLRRSLQ